MPELCTMNAGILFKKTKLRNATRIIIHPLNSHTLYVCILIEKHIVMYIYTYL